METTFVVLRRLGGMKNRSSFRGTIGEPVTRRGPASGSAGGRGSGGGRGGGESKCHVGSTAAYCDGGKSRRGDERAVAVAAGPGAGVATAARAGMATATRCTEATAAYARPPGTRAAATWLLIAPSPRHHQRHQAVQRPAQVAHERPGLGGQHVGVQLPQHVGGRGPEHGARHRIAYQKSVLAMAHRGSELVTENRAAIEPIRNMPVVVTHSVATRNIQSTPPSTRTHGQQRQADHQQQQQLEQAGGEFAHHDPRGRDRGGQQGRQRAAAGLGEDGAAVQDQRRAASR